MKVIQSKLSGVLILEPKIFKDDRGYFYESYNASILLQHGINTVFKQDNQSKSQYGVIRGLHFQNGNFAQTKLVRVQEGAIYDVAVDIRKNSPTFGEWFGIELSAENFLQLYIPKGFAHGFSVLSKTAVVSYKCDEYYNKDSEGGLLFNDSTLNIDWKIPFGDAIISEKDMRQPTFEFVKANSNFVF
jgi:dTDP-4-dehydrorhamnose 3,5-epimerase